MTDICWQRVIGNVQQGYKIASGNALNSRYPRGTIEMQIPFFKELGIDLNNFFKGTLNVSISPNTFEVIAPEFTFRDVVWYEKRAPENFSFSRCRIIFKDLKYDSWIYYPRPETKIRHIHAPFIIEVIAPLINEIEYGSMVEIEYNSSEISVKNACLV
jgi:hypothetical protein